MKRNLFAILLTLTLVVALAFVVAPTAQAADVLTPDDAVKGKITVSAADQILDLKGENLTVVFTKNVELSVIDTTIKQYADGTNNAGTLTVEGTGSIAAVSTDPTSKMHFLAVNNGSTYSFYPFNLTVSQQGINTLAKNPDEGKKEEIEPAACLRVSFVAFKPVIDEIDAYGFIVDGIKYPVTKEFTGNITHAYADLQGSLRDGKIDLPKSVQAYMTINNVDYTSAERSFTPREILKGINKDAKVNPNEAQMGRIETLFDTEGYARVKNILTRFRSFVKETAMSFANNAQRVSQDSSKQVWKIDNILLTNNKASASSNVVGDVNPVRFYSGSEVVIECAGMTKIVFTCNNTSYATALAKSLTASKIDSTVNSKNVTITFAEAVDSITVKMSAQVRVDSLVVTAPVGGNCEHHGGIATCTVQALCLDCDQPYGELADHNITSTATCLLPSQCSVCGNVGKTVDCKDDDKNGTCDWCGETLKTATTETLNIYANKGTLNSGKTEITWTAASSKFTFTNTKGSTAIRTSDSDHYRVYAGSKAIITGLNGAKITKIVINCTGTNYMPSFASVTGATITTSGTVVTIVLDEGVDSITLNHTGGAQWRVKNIQVTYR